MIVWDLNPAIVIGPVEIRWYGLVYALGFLLGYWILKTAARRRLIPNLTEKLAEDYILLLAMGGILMSRLFHVLFYNPAYYLRNLSEIPAVWHGGLSVHGGLVGAVLVTWYFCRKHRINFYHIADTLIVPFSFVFLFGKLTNYANAELYGTTTDVPWCVQFPSAEGCRHPVQIYEALYSYAIFWALLGMQLSRRFAQGVLFWSYIILYGLLRFLVSFVRQPEPGEAVLLGLSMGQWLSLATVLAGLAWFWMVSRTGHPLWKKH